MRRPRGSRRSSQARPKSPSAVPPPARDGRIDRARSGLVGRPDEEHLARAAGEGRVLYTFNVGDFMRLHGEYMTEGRAHAGVIFGDQQRFGVGEQMRRLLRIISLRSAEELRGGYEFLSAWQ